MSINNCLSEPARNRISGAPRVFVAITRGIVAMAIASLPLAAQRVTVPVVTTIDSMRADGSYVAVPLRTPSSRFDLFATSDQACAAYRSTGDLVGAAANFRGPVPFDQGTRCPAQLAGQRYAFFEMGLSMSTPPHEFKKIQAVHSDVRYMLGSLGYNANWQFVTSTPNRTVIDAADDQFGKRFSGATVVFGAGCIDDTYFFQAGITLMAMKDCPETWGSEGYKGKLAVPDSVFRNRFTANANAFNWDEFRIRESQLDQTKYLGAQSFYGYMSDYSREIRLRYGVVVPGGSGAPTEQGYPLGIEMRVDGWQSSNAQLRNTQFYQLTIVNNSAKLYGSPIDYDSLYFGLTPGLFMGADHMHGVYFDLPRNSIHFTPQGKSGNCSSTYPRRYFGTTAGCSLGGRNVGIYTFTWLKSPLGDERNKLFSNPASVFYSPGHPLSGDTINYNHAIWGGFGNNAFSSGTMRRAFGAMAGNELALLDGRTPTEMGRNNYLAYFTPENDVIDLPTPQTAKLNKFVPSTTTNPKTGQRFGGWDYNHDGVPDTISVPGCGRQGCHALWSDTNAGGFRQQWDNIHNSFDAGPFRLKASDTTQFLWAFTWSPDTIEVDRRINAVLDAYKNNWPGPRPIVFPNVNAARDYEVQSGQLLDSVTAGVANAMTVSRVIIRLPQIRPVDDFLPQEIARIRRDSLEDVGRTRLLLRLNPQLFTRLAARANDNLAEVYIFKSCDNGATWTAASGATAPCVSSPTRNVGSAPLSFAWQPWKIVSYNNGAPSISTLTDDLQPGHNYLYSMVTRTRGTRDLVVIDSGAQGFTTTDVETAFSIARDTINSPFAVSGGTTISIYAPMTDAAGRIYARVDTATLSGRATQGIQFSNIGSKITGTTRLVFANRFIVRKAIDTLSNAASTSVVASYVLPAAVVNPGDPVVANFVARSQTFAANSNIPVSGLATGTLRSISGSSRVYVDTINIANSVGHVWITSDNEPIYVSTQLTSTFEREQQLSPLFPGFTMRTRDSASSATGFRVEQVASTGLVRDRHFVLRPNGDTVQSGAWQFTPFVQAIGFGVKKNRGGAYTLTWDTDPWGPSAPFTLEPVDKLQAVVTASLEAATGKATSITTTDAAIATQAGATTARPLVRVRVPFSMTFRDAETGEVRPVTFATLRRAAFPFNTRLLGSGNDTLRVSVPDSIWLPGDTLYAIHKVYRDSTILAGATRVTVVEPETLGGTLGFRPIRVAVDSVALQKFVVSCSPTAISAGVRANAFERSTCNPLAIGTRGATTSGGYLPVEPKWTEYFELTRTFDSRSQVALTAIPFTTPTALTKAALSKVNVVPNPYVVRSDFDPVGANGSTARIWFTGLPEQGTLRIYTVSGAWVQELKWTSGDLTYQGNITSTGDLPFNLKTRGGYDMNSGLYLFVVTATDAQGKNVVHSGKFAIIR